MALTKDKLIIEIQNHLGMNKREAQQIVSRLFKIMKDTLSGGKICSSAGSGNSRLGKKRRAGGGTLKLKRV